ncbi:membrane-binding protein [uncultured Cyclobacterium sp.]|uniref:toxin-antitoxin system YwqK family antitoxin n=1 Tax=uncultured Cyclobacterium sp. TaxID=453820 RepID=UPI0030EDFB01|tara:strand:+ start:123263 stop:123886 length:624 start_codon:yes stop_codon:yes gene_type:complete
MIRNFIFILLLLSIASCKEESKTAIITQAKEAIPLFEVPTNTIDKSKLVYNNKVSLWTLDGEKFSGYAISYYPDSTLKQKIGILDGKKQNETTDWYPDGRIKHLAYYHLGRLHGEKKTWTTDVSHLLISHLQYYSGKLHGVQKKWYPTGEIFKVLTLNMGREEGLQQAFRKNGDLFANYEAKNGRIFGLKRAVLCVGLEDEVVQYED